MPLFLHRKTSRLLFPSIRNGLQDISSPSCHKLAYYPTIMNIFTAQYHSSSSRRGLEEFSETKSPNEQITTGRGWTVVDLRRKVSP